MRIAIVCPYAVDRPGGVQGQAVQLVEWLREDGHQAFLVAPGESGGPKGTVYLGPPVEVPANGSVVPIVLRPGVGRQVAEVVRHADVVHIHEPLTPLVSLGALAEETPAKVGSFFADLAGWTSRLSWVVRRLPQRLVGHLDVATAVSPVAAKAIEEHGADVRIIPCAVDVASYRTDGCQMPTRAVFLGRDEPRKGLDVLLGAWPAVRSAVPDAELVVLGAVRDPQPGVYFRGTVDDAEKRRMLASASVLVAPNLCSESFGIVLLEGMAAGCAIVASALPAFTFVLDGAAVMVPSGDRFGLAHAITGLLRDPELRRSHAERGRRRVVEFDRHRILAAYLVAYQAAIDARAASRR